MFIGFGGPIPVLHATGTAAQQPRRMPGFGYGCTDTLGRGNVTRLVEGSQRVHAVTVAHTDHHGECLCVHRAMWWGVWRRYDKSAPAWMDRIQVLDLVLETFITQDYTPRMGIAGHGGAVTVNDLIYVARGYNGAVCVTVGSG